MVGVILISHGKMADGMKDSAELIFGNTEEVTTASLVAGQDFDVFKKEVFDKIESADTGDGVLVFVDLFGASPYNASMFAKKELEAKGKKIRVITGMNLSMILEVLPMRSALNLEALVQMALNSGREGIQEPILIGTDEGDDY